MERFVLHPDNPQLRAIRRAAEILRAGGVIAYPTDSCYALGCHIGDKDALERIRRIREADRHHHFTLVCRDLTEIARYARIDTWQFRLLKSCTPGPYTFLLEATREVPRRLQHEKRRTIGLRVPDHKVVQLLLAELGEPIMSSTLILPGDGMPLNDAEEIEARKAAAPVSAPHALRGYRRLYLEQVLQAEQGVDFAFLRPAQAAVESPGQTAV